MKTAKRFLKFGHLKLEVPENLSVEQAIETYKTNYPELAFATLGAEEIVGDEVIYPLITKQVGTKG